MSEINSDDFDHQEISEENFGDYDYYNEGDLQLRNQDNKFKDQKPNLVKDEEKVEVEGTDSQNSDNQEYQDEQESSSNFERKSNEQQLDFNKKRDRNGASNRKQDSSNNYEDDEDEEDSNFEYDNGQSDSNHLSSSQSQAYPERIIEESILQELLPEENTGKFRDQICLDIISRMEKLDLDLENKSPQQVVQIRSVQLAKAKILVLVHDRSPFRLVVAETRLGSAYLQYQCYEQAQEHLNMALRKNKEFVNENDKTKVYNAYILTLLGRCNYERKDYQMGLDNLELARNIEMDYPDRQISSFKTMMLISNCYLKMKDYANADQKIFQLLQNIEREKTSQCTEYAEACIEKAKIKHLREAYFEAEDYQNSAIQILIDLNYRKPEFIAQAYQVLSHYQEKTKNVKQQMLSLKKARTIVQQIYSPEVGKVIKLTKQIIRVLAKNGQMDDALAELSQTLQLERKTYGENSIHVGKTLKMMATVYQQLRMMEESKSHLKEAERILNQKKGQKVEAGNKSKLRFVKQIRQSKRFAPNKQLGKIV